MYVFRIVFERHVSKISKIGSLGGYITLFYEAPFDLGLRPWTNIGNQIPSYKFSYLLWPSAQRG